MLSIHRLFFFASDRSLAGVLPFWISCLSLFLFIHDLSTLSFLFGQSVKNIFVPWTYPVEHRITKRQLTVVSVKVSLWCIGF